MFDSQVSLESKGHRVLKKRNIQEIRPGGSAMQWHCGLRLFFKKHTYSTVHYCTLLYMVCSVETSFIFWTNGPQMTLLFRSIGQNTSFLLLFEKRFRIPCLVRSCECASIRSFFLLLFGSLDIDLWWGVAALVIFVVVPLIDNVVLRIDALCRSLWVTVRAPKPRNTFSAARSPPETYQLSLEQIQIRLVPILKIRISWFRQITEYVPYHVPGHVCRKNYSHFAFFAHFGIAIYFSLRS